MVLKVADVQVPLGRIAYAQVPRSQTGGIVVIETEEIGSRQFLELHQRLVEVGGIALALAGHGLVPHLCNGGDVIVVLVDEIVEPVALVTVPLMRERVVVGLTEHADALVEHLLRVRLVGLPLCRLLPDGLPVAALQVEPRVVRL